MQYNMICVEYKRELDQFLYFIDDLHKKRCISWNEEYTRRVEKSTFLV